jgi:translation initiation factor IF-1
MKAWGSADVARDRGAAGRPVKATVLELLPQAGCRLELEDRRQVLAHAAGAARVNFVRVRPGDKVWVELSPADPARGRITKLLSER